MILKNLRKIREGLGLYQQQLADQLLVSCRTIINWEAGKNVYPNTAKRVAVALGVTVAELTGNNKLKEDSSDDN